MKQAGLIVLTPFPFIELMGLNYAAHYANTLAPYNSN